MKNEIRKQIIQSAAAIICVAAVCISAITSVDKISGAIKDTAAPASVQPSDGQPTGGNVSGDDAIIPDGGADSAVTPDASGEDQTQAPDAAASTGDSGTGTASSSGTSKTQPSATKASSGPQTKAEIINYCNTALNKAKAAKVGYNKKMVRAVKGSTDGISPSLIKLVAADKSTTMKKGSSDIKDDFPAAGYDWSSKLREQDVAAATIKTSGQYYEIRLTLGKEQNPAKGESSSYGRVMSVIDAAEAGKMVPGIKSINMSYHDGYVYAKVDIKTGKLVAAEFSAAADIQASITIFGDVSVKDIVSTETFTNIVW